MLRGTTFYKVDTQITHWMAHNGVRLLRISLGIVFLWFGGLKFFPSLSPAEGIATETIEVLSLGIIQPQVSIIMLAVWEVLIGIGLLTGRMLRETLLLMFVQMLGTIMPIFLFPEQVFHLMPVSLTLEGQYIVKNLVLVSAGIVIGATVRGGRLIADPIE